jgi:hypothetical protein
MKLIKKLSYTFLVLLFVTACTSLSHQPDELAYGVTAFGSSCSDSIVEAALYE